MDHAYHSRHWTHLGPVDQDPHTSSHPTAKDLILHNPRPYCKTSKIALLSPETPFSHLISSLPFSTLVLLLLLLLLSITKLGHFQGLPRLSQALRASPSSPSSSSSTLGKHTLPQSSCSFTPSMLGPCIYELVSFSSLLGM